MKKQYILFDLDGTLTDSQDGIINSVIYALDKYGIRVEDRSALRVFVGPPLVDSMMKYYGFGHEEALEAVKKYREYFSTRGLYENSVYPGVEAMLQRLRAQGYTLMLATSKPEKFTVTILEHFGLLPYFDFVGAATMDEKRTHKGEVIRYVLEANGLLEKREQVMMVGDRENDVRGAKENGVECIGVLYGYGGLEELKTAGADYLAETVEDIEACLAEC